MAKPSCWAFAAVLLSLVARPGAASAEPLAMPAEAVNAFQAFAEATQQLTKAKGAMVAIETGEKPQTGSQDWAGLMGGFEAAAEAIKRSSGPAVPDASTFGVPLEQLRSCATRQAALGNLDKQFRSLHALSQQVSETRSILRSRLELAHTADDTLRYLLKRAGRLADRPQLAEVFTWSWPELEARTSKAIAAYSNELRRYQDRVERGGADLKARAASLAGQLESFGEAKDCLLAGRWAGTKSQAGTVDGMMLHLVGSASSWSGTANLDGKNLSVRSIAISGNTVSVNLDGRVSLKGTLSGDGRSYHGSLYSLDGLGSFALAKQ